MAKKKRKIQDYDPWYSLLRHYVDTVLKLSYSKIIQTGRENIPDDGAVIYAPNHTGTLMDALVILASDRKPKVFVARADIFKNPKLAKMFRFFKMMPIMRMRDGFDEVKKNNKTIEQAVDVLKDKVPFCIFPEGTHQTKYSLQPISKGIFRIALQAQELMSDMPLYIVPVGIRYGNFWRFRSTAHVHFGEPMKVSDYIGQNSDKTPQELMNIMKASLEKRMKETLVYIPNNEDYDATYEICAATINEQIKTVKDNRKVDVLALQSNANNKTVKLINALKESNPQAAEKVLSLGNKAIKLRKSKGISLKSVVAKHSLLFNIAKLMLLLATLPYTIVITVLTLPLILLCNKVCGMFKDRAFDNSVRMLMNLLAWPLLMIIYTIISYICLPWQWALPLTLVILPAPYLIHDIYKGVRVLVSDFKLCCCKPLKAIYKEIRELVFK
ncbi:MAG: 1-acyl-sn-glycerol-3-phosphate acyltransferase [Bacteroidaceae bacterium]|nr:1-acyl-sn-glycerol-3-phosphate acyltransferase [Bacteroidaceae bacterium]